MHINQLMTSSLDALIKSWHNPGLAIFSASDYMTALDCLFRVQNKLFNSLICHVIKDTYMCKYVPLLKIAKVENEVFEIPFLYANHQQWLSIRN